MNIERPPNVFGQGKRVTTLLTEDGCHFPVISHAPYVERRGQSAPFSTPQLRSLRRHSLHSSTFILGDPLYSDFKTTSQQNFSGSKSLNPVRRPPKCPSMHKSQVVLGKANNGMNSGDGDWNTSYTNTYFKKDIIPANRLHLISMKNKLDQTDGADINKIVCPDSSVASYWSQYGRIHSKLGCILGPGVPQGYPIRQQYNLLTGECKGSAWKDKNARISGNRILHSCRQRFSTTPVIG
ncbi:uncharacterized protein LOC126809835 [Patella vulgata]|uniref:uncharacterized protein LOC126809835 n=1 Tax=Patella vulgata TaxID=6465 RepID=UPI00218031B9|nr:uncharacterized protein LOC126809835 [Patella vulgata]